MTTAAIGAIACGLANISFRFAQHLVIVSPDDNRECVLPLSNPAVHMNWARVSVAEPNSERALANGAATPRGTFPVGVVEHRYATSALAESPTRRSGIWEVTHR